MTDLEHLDELERQGDSHLDEERWRVQLNDRWAVQAWTPNSLMLFLDDGPIGLDSARRLAHAILSEIEIIERGDSIR